MTSFIAVLLFHMTSNSTNDVVHGGITVSYDI